MVKIKTEKKMNLAELIQWAFDNPNKVIGKSIFPDNRISGEIYFAANGGVVFHDKFHAKDDTFTLEVEEEITEETEIPLLLEVRNNLTVGISTVAHRNEKISGILDKKLDHVGIITMTIHKINEDGTTTLLWTKEGGMQ